MTFYVAMAVLDAQRMLLLRNIAWYALAQARSSLTSPL